MTIDKIFIPTVHRTDSQITYQNLPDELRKKVVFVIQHWEKDFYDYDCDYLILPDTEEYHYSHYYCFSKTKKFIYEYAKNMKYALIDDDIIFHRRNTKYFSPVSNMEKSKRKCNSDDILEMFELYSNWLDENDVTVCGCSHVENPPSKKMFLQNTSVSSAFWINGKDFKDSLASFDLTSVRVAQDVCFLLHLLTNGYGNRVSNEFVFQNVSNSRKTMTSTQWDSQTEERTLTDHKIIENMFPDFFKIVYDENGSRVSGGYRKMGKLRISWGKAYKERRKSFLDL